MLTLWVTAFRVSPKTTFNVDLQVRARAMSTFLVSTGTALDADVQICADAVSHGVSSLPYDGP